VAEAIAFAALLVRGYDEAITYITAALGFRLPAAGTSCRQAAGRTDGVVPATR
jgi:hypothetical protein